MQLGLAKRLTLAAAMAVASAACDPYVTVTGVVRDTSGSPIQDVTVDLETAGRSARRSTTANNGSFNIGMVGVDPRSTSISFRKQGFQDVRKVVGENARATINVTLVPLPVQ